MNFGAFKEKIEACHICAAYCDKCATLCLQEKEVQAMAECIRMDIQCAQICRLAASYMAQNSEYTNDVCQLCADICQKCADECAKHDVEHCQECANACQQCANACANIAA
ncbi:four-helix bundle copper-binding protein [Halomonas sp. CnH100-B]|uniref:four-helix bundle copper-binding protein n=1 Tax=Halomonas sp. CnH100-B TaxID=2954490 RepID=UPI002096FB7C|nr:four-helix bundle copper-binding protein [Halomonas sp. CnH100-B]MCO7227750.1 four-helix bundle copper-binding protein [Halomonas sp. CnH100-B]